MPVSAHSHSGQFCSHARGDLESVVTAAAGKGFVCYGLTEHMPRARAEHLYPEEVEAGLTPRDLEAKFEAFVKRARALQNEAANMQVLVGMETEFFSAAESVPAIQALVARHNLDYVVGSLHHVNEIPIDYSEALVCAAEASCVEGSGALGGADVPAAQDSLEASGARSEALFCAYFAAQKSMLQTIRPLVVGHFDLIRLFRPRVPLSPEVWSLIRENVAIIKSYGGLVEVNARAWKKGLGSAYPFPDILQYMVSQGLSFTLSDDSHAPDEAGLWYGSLPAYLTAMGITQIHYPVRDNLADPVSVRVLPDIARHPFWASASV